MGTKAAFAGLWALLLHLTLVLALLGHTPLPQGRPGPGAGIELRLSSSVAETNPAPSALAGVAPKLEQDAAAKTADTAQLQPGGAGGDPYLALVRGRLVQQKALARGRGQVLLRFRIAADGAVQAVRVERSSGDAELDRAAVMLARRASPLPAPPRPLDLLVPVEFKSG